MCERTTKVKYKLVHRGGLGWMNVEFVNPGIKVMKIERNWKTSEAHFIT